MLQSSKSILITCFDKTLGYFNNPFRHIAEKSLWREKLMRQAPPDTRYIIFFTPRSGSSRLTDLVQLAGGLGTPDECFNPQHIRNMAKFLGAQNLDDYLDLLMRRRTTGGTFGCEATPSQIHRIFFSVARFFEMYRPTSCIFLIRENIAEQAVSCSRMSQTGFSHHTSSSDPENTGTSFEYRPAEIRKYMTRLLIMERQLEQIFLRRSIEPLRLSYEMLVNTDPEIFLASIARHVGATPHRLNDLESEHKKIGDQRNLEFTVQFTKENRRLMAKVARQRVFTLNELARQKNSHF